VCVARQPILTRKLKVFGYELLYRMGDGPVYNGIDSTAATASVITSSFLGIGIDRLVEKGRAFINFDRTLLLSRAVDALPPERVVIELLETIVVDDDVVARCQELKRRGFTLALDDVVSEHGLERVIRFADIIKVDFAAADREMRRELAAHLGHCGKALLAEKVENPDDFESAVEMGYALFQGYFFARPNVVRGPDVRPSNHRRLRLLECTSGDDFDFETIEEVLRTEPELSYQLLRYLNSARFAWKSEIRSVRHALALLGAEEIRRWSALVALCGMAKGCPEALLSYSVIRARFCESVSKYAGKAGGDGTSELFLMGLLSMLDAILSCPLESVVNGLHLSSGVQEALLGKDSTSTAATIYSLVKAVERGDWEQAAPFAGSLGVSNIELSRIYCEAVDWARKLEL